MAELRLKNKKQFKALYQKEAQKYDIRRSTSYEGQQVDKLQINFITKQLQSLSNKRKAKILEAGCGTGRILIPLAKKGFNCSGFDPSQNMLSVIRQKAKENKVSIKVKKGDIEKMSYPDNSFDVIYTMHVLMHMPDYKKAIKEMYRVLKPNGLLIADFPNKNSIWTKLSLLLDPHRKRTRLFTKKELEKFFDPYDYEISGLFSYARTFYKIPFIRYIITFLEKLIPLPVSWRGQLLVVVRKH